MKFYYIVGICTLLFSFPSVAQLEVNVKATAGSEQIKDGTIDLEVLNGQAPYHFKWSNRGTAQDSPNSTGNDEGTVVHVKITDSLGSVKELDVEVPAVSGAEKCPDIRAAIPQTRAHNGPQFSIANSSRISSHAYCLLF